MYNTGECVLQFAAEVVPVENAGHFDGEFLQTTEWESENGNQRCVIQELGSYETLIPTDDNLSDGGLDDRKSDKELMKPLVDVIMITSTSKTNCREEAFWIG
jgi:hypothetical protein